jgi:hypothetical protein
MKDGEYLDHDDDDDYDIDNSSDIWRRVVD